MIEVHIPKMGMSTVEVDVVAVHVAEGDVVVERALRAGYRLRAALVEAAQAAGRTKRTSLGAQFRRLAARRGKKQAAGAGGPRAGA